MRNRGKTGKLLILGLGCIYLEHQQIMEEQEF